MPDTLAFENVPMRIKAFKVAIAALSASISYQKIDSMRDV